MNTAKFTIIALLLTFASHSQTAAVPTNPQYFEAEMAKPHTLIAIAKVQTQARFENSLVLKTQSEACLGDHGIALTLLSGEQLDFEANAVGCTELPNHQYQVTGSVALTQDLYDKLSHTEIVAFRLGGLLIPLVFRNKDENLRALFAFAAQSEEDKH